MPWIGIVAHLGLDLPFLTSHLVAEEGTVELAVLVLAEGDDVGVVGDGRAVVDLSSIE
jgi:hypothetical protein